MFAIFCSLLAACGTSSEYDTIQDLPEEGWVMNNTLKFPVEITDNTKPYEFYYSVRYDNTYPYYNFYATRFLYDSSGKLIAKQLQQMNLFNPQTGAPYGSGIGSKKDYSIKSQSDLVFPYIGKFNIEVKHYMRIDTIPGIKAFGIRLDKKVATP